jgi:hypothetical protein
MAPRRAAESAWSNIAIAQPASPLRNAVALIVIVRQPSPA